MSQLNMYYSDPNWSKFLAWDKVKQKINNSQYAIRGGYDAGGWYPMFIESNPTSYVEMKRGYDYSYYNVGLNPKFGVDNKLPQAIVNRTGNPQKAIDQALYGNYPRYDVKKNPFYTTLGEWERNQNIVVTDNKANTVV